ncbi:hypothetical protein D3C72_1778670 [compost metagenome]
MQEQPVILGLQAYFQGRVEQRGKLILKAFEQTQHQRLLAVEVVVQVARADPHFIGDLQGRDIRFALLVEQLQGTLENSVAGFHPFYLFNALARKCRARGPWEGSSGYPEPSGFRVAHRSAPESIPAIAATNCLRPAWHRRARPAGHCSGADCRHNWPWDCRVG